MTVLLPPTYSTQLSAWLKTFLQSRALNFPDQRPLYRYHCTLSEYSTLKSLLKDSSPSTSLLSHRSFHSAFVFYCSEWYRREYCKEHGWSWDGIFVSLGWHLNQTQLRQALEQGLEKFWQRHIHYHISERRDFLGTVFSEGGLPFVELGRDGSRFQSLFEIILKEYDNHHQWGKTTTYQVGQLLNKSTFPHAFSTDTSIELISEMAERLVDLVNNFQLASEQDPANHLDSVHPRWKEQFPIPLDDKTGNDLLTGLLTTATKEGKRRMRRPDSWRCIQRLSLVAINTIETELIAPEKITLTLESAAPINRFELQITEDGKVVADLGAAYAQIHDNKANFHPRVKSVVFTRNSVNTPIHLVAKAAGVTVASEQIKDSAIDIGESPVAFKSIDGRWELCGQASFTTQETHLLIVLPRDAEAHLEQGDENTSLEKQNDRFSHSCIAVKGTSVLLVKAEDQYRIRTGHRVNTEAMAELSGRTLDWPSRPAWTFIGLPSAHPPRQADHNGQELQVFINRQSLGQANPSELFGAQYVTIKSNSNDTLLRRKVGILPEDFAIELTHGEHPTHGYITVSSKQRFIVEIVSENLEISQQKADNKTVISLRSNERPPAKVKLNLYANLAADPIELEVPFPGSGCIALDANEQSLPRIVCIDNLLGSRLLLYPQPRLKTHYSLELSLHGAINRQAYYRWGFEVANKPLEISLFEMREQIHDLLSLTDNLDASVNLEIQGPGSARNFRIQRYATQLNLDLANHKFSIVQLSQHAGVPKPLLLLLPDPFRGAISLNSRQSEGVSTGVFELPKAIDNDGPWLIVPERDSNISFRPIFVPGSATRPTGDILSLQKAVQAFDHQNENNAFIPVLDAMAKNPNHSGWTFIQTLYDRFNHLSLTTFEVWKALMKHPQARAMASVKFEMEGSFLSRIESEFPIVWEFEPIDDLHQALRYFKAYLIDNGIEENATIQILANSLKALQRTFPSFGEHLRDYLCDLPLKNGANLPEEVLSILVPHWYQNLLQEQSEASWPEYGASQLQRWHQGLKNPVIRIPNDLGFRNAVLYLPEFAAAVASGQAKISDVFDQDSESIFFIRQVRNFNTSWFNALYECCLLKNLINRTHN